MHLLAVLGQNAAMAKADLVGSFTLQNCALSEHSVEPVAELTGEGFSDEVSWEPLLPIGTVGSVSKGAEADYTGVKPRITYFRYPTSNTTAFLASDPDSVNVGSVGAVSIKLLPTGDRLTL